MACASRNVSAVFGFRTALLVAALAVFFSCFAAGIRDQDGEDGESADKARIGEGETQSSSVYRAGGSADGGSGTAQAEAGATSSCNGISNVTVMQWNILADGLSFDGFRSPSDSDWKTFYEGSSRAVKSIKWLNERTELSYQFLENELFADHLCTGKGNGTSEPENLVPTGGITTKELETALHCTKACITEATNQNSKVKDKAIKKQKTCFIKNMLNEADETTGEKTDAKWAELKKEQEDEAGREKELVGWDSRFKNMLSIINDTNPDVIVLEELDHYADFAKDLAFRYTSVCNNTDHALYTTKGMLRKRLEAVAAENSEEDYKRQIKELEEEGVAFAPTLKSKSRELAIKRENLPDGADSRYTIDDRGTGIFWRKSYSCKAVQMVIHADGDAASLSVSLKSDTEADFTVIGTHLSSGPEKENVRCEELAGKDGQLGIMSLMQKQHERYIFAGDFNSDVFFDQWDEVKKESGTQECKEKKSSFERITHKYGMSSIWGSDCNAAPPTTVFKMRGAGTDQPTKMGSLQMETIDNIFYKGGGLRLEKAFVKHPNLMAKPDDPIDWTKCFSREAFDPNKLKDKFENHDMEEEYQKCFMYMLPSFVTPSDHWPVVATFQIDPCMDA